MTDLATRNLKRTGFRLGWPRGLLRHWPWLGILGVLAAAIGLGYHFPDDLDREYPSVARPTFSPHPPMAYRWAEPGESIDRLSLYLASIGVGGTILGYLRCRRLGHPIGLRPLAIAWFLAAAWHSATPWPTFDGWHGLGWRVIGDPSAPVLARILLGSIGVLLLCWSAIAHCRTRVSLYEVARNWRRDDRALLAGIGIVGVLMRVVGWPDPEPAGFWPRWAFVAGLVGWLGVVYRSRPQAQANSMGNTRLLRVASALLASGLTTAAGLALLWYHRPLERLRTVEPGKVYISAMPSYEGLRIEHTRIGFRTIINLFPEHTEKRHANFSEEERFARENGIRLITCPESESEFIRSMERNLKIARDPAAQPVLVHCHGCMDRSPAWMGIYRFVVQGRPLSEIMQELEAHRGWRPKASVTLLYNFYLPRLAPDRFPFDSTAQRLLQLAGDTENPYLDLLEARANPNDPISLHMNETDEVRRP